MSDSADAPITAQEASDFLEAAIAILCEIEESERSPSSAVPRAIATCGQVEVLLSGLVALIALQFPHLVEADDRVPDLAALRYRSRH